jgi:hypothetical protein
VKKQNTNRDETARDYLLRAVRTIQAYGIEVTAGFIIGLDRDTEFQPHIDFIQQAGIPRAMTGLLTAIKKTNLYNRLEKEGRLLHESTGNNVSVELNFVPELDREVLISEYKRVLRALYDPSLKHFFARCLTLFEHFKPRQRLMRIGRAEIRALMKSIWRQLLSRQQGPAYLWFLWQVLRRYPSMLPNAVRMAIMGYHFEKVTYQQVAIDDFKQYLACELDTFKDTVSRFANAQSNRIGEMGQRTQHLLASVRKQYEDIHEDFRHGVRDTLDAFQKSVFKQYLEAELNVFKEAVSRSAHAHTDRLDDVNAYVQHLFNRVHAQYEQIHYDFRSNVQDTLEAFRSAVKRHLEQGLGPIHPHID